MPELERVKAIFQPRGVGFLALSLEPDAALTRAGATRLGLTGLVATTADETLTPLGVRLIPSTVFVGPDGRIVAAASGPQSRAFFERRVGELQALLDQRRR